VKKALLYILFFAFCLSSTELHQLLKLPVLFSHFQEHKQRDSSITFLSFLKTHYSDSKNVNSTEKGKHEQLPFKSDTDIAAHNISFYHPVASFQLPIIFHAFEPRKHPIHNIDYLASSLSSIWQPPKLA
jgi:hypothetical protein